MELASPTIADAIHKCVKAGAKDIIIAPYFLSRSCCSLCCSCPFHVSTMLSLSEATAGRPCLRALHHSSDASQCSVQVGMKQQQGEFSCSSIKPVANRFICDHSWKLCACPRYASVITEYRPFPMFSWGLLLGWPEGKANSRSFRDRVLVERIARQQKAMSERKRRGRMLALITSATRGGDGRDGVSVGQFGLQYTLSTRGR